MPVLVVSACLVAAYALATLAVPGLGAPFLADRFTRLWLPTTAHIAAGALALAVGVFQFQRRRRERHTGWHRRLGWVYATCVLLSGAGGLRMALAAEGGPIARWGFGLLAVAWLLTTGLAVQAILAGNRAAHGRWMTRSYSLAFAAVTLRVLLPAGLAAGWSFEATYQFVSWAAWVPNLIAVEWWRHRRG